MHILNLNKYKYLDKFEYDFYNLNDYYLILSTPCELNKIKSILNIDEITFNKCLNFDESIKLDLLDNYDFLSLNIFEVKDNKTIVSEINICLANNYILVTSNEETYIYNYVRSLMKDNYILDKTPNISLFKINYLILKEIVVNSFESLEKIEDLILELEDKMISSVKDKYLDEISEVRRITRIIVKNIRPLLYIGDRLLKENTRYLDYSDIKKHNLENLQRIDFRIDKLYSFAISTRELADKLLDIYSSQVAEKTNNLITKLTLLTGISAPITIITGIYGMNFEFMPFLKWHFGYYITIFVMFLIMILGIIIFKLKKIL